MKEIIKEFREKFWIHRVPRYTKQSKDIEDFILEKLSKQKEEILGKLLKERDLSGIHSVCDEDFNQFLTEIKKIIKE